MPVGTEHGDVAGTQPAVADRLRRRVGCPQYPGVTLASAICSSPGSLGPQTRPPLVTRQRRCHIGTPTSPGVVTGRPGGLIVTVDPASLIP
jgi:hypothetical protein